MLSIFSERPSSTDPLLLASSFHYFADLSDVFLQRAMSCCWPTSCGMQQEVRSLIGVQICKWKETSMIKSSLIATAILSLPLAFGDAASAQTTANKPNIVMIMADDVGIWNISAYYRGMMGGSTPNIDRIAKEGALFTDYYAQQSCTAGRAAFILGQSPFRTGLLKVGMPAAKQGLQDKDPTIAELLKPYGYATAQIGKNHLGDRNEYLPTVHGFDEFYGILYHLNAMEEPYEADYPKSPPWRKGYDLRRRLPRADGCEVARHHKARSGDQRHRRGR